METLDAADFCSWKPPAFLSNLHLKAKDTHEAFRRFQHSASNQLDDIKKSSHLVHILFTRVKKRKDKGKTLSFLCIQ